MTERNTSRICGSLTISGGGIVSNPTPPFRNKSRRADVDVYHEVGMLIKLCVPKVVYVIGF